MRARPLFRYFGVYMELLLIPVVTLQIIKVVSDIMAKHRNYLAHVYQFKTCCDLGHSVKDTDLISILSCLKVTASLLILLVNSLD